MQLTFLADLKKSFIVMFFFSFSVYSAEHSLRLFQHREDYGAPRGTG